MCIYPDITLHSCRGQAKSIEPSRCQDGPSRQYTGLYRILWYVLSLSIHFDLADGVGLNAALVLYSKLVYINANPFLIFMYVIAQE